jgi:tRNA uridine 5-carboxymethylaminomethyl modification enzyme
MNLIKSDIIVVGAGHAGIEASLIAAKLGLNVICVTLNTSLIGEMSCNPSIGGVAKGIVVREVDALGGEMGKAIDKTGIQFRMLNMSKGPAVWSPRAQADKVMYSLYMQKAMQDKEGLTLLEDKVLSLIVKQDKVVGVRTQKSGDLFTKAVVITTGTFLNGQIFVGDFKEEAGRVGDKVSNELTKALNAYGIKSGRMKTGTPVRINSRSINFDKIQKQENQDYFFCFSHQTKELPVSKVHCYITYTNPQTHEVIANNLSKSPLYYGLELIEGVGPRYCPSIEDKVVKFPHKERHQIFLEPETLYNNSIYVNGISSSLPVDVQREFLHTIEGLENAEILKPGYAVEYDFFDPTQLFASLESKVLKNLFLAGQVNGTTGYEEAAGQGFMAGVNAAFKVLEKEPFIIGRDEGYIGILIDDLVTKGVMEPYRLFNSSSEYRLHLRHDNADQRLMPKAFERGLITQKEYLPFLEKWSRIKEGFERIYYAHIKPSDKENIPAFNKEPIKIGDPYYKALLKGLTMQEINTLPFFEGLSLEEIFGIFVKAKYHGYLKQQEDLISKFRKMENHKIPSFVDYFSVEHLREEAIEKFHYFKPESIGQASRISGINSADIWSLVIHIQKIKKQYKENRNTML